MYKPKATKQGATAHGWHQIEPIFRCYMEYKLASVVGARVPLLATPDPLGKGSIFHGGRDTWWSSGFKTDTKTVAKVMESMRKMREEMQPPIGIAALQDAQSYMQQYIEHWGVRPLPKVVGTEYNLGPITLKAGQHWVLERTARLDDVAYYPEARGADGKPMLCIGECKTTSVGVDDAANEYDLHGQLLMQMCLWKMAPQGEAKHGPVSHVMLDVIKKGYGKEKCTFARVPIRVTERSLRSFVESMEWYLMQAARITEFTWVPRNNKQCTRQVGRMRLACPYRELCKHGDAAASAYVTRDGTSLATKYADSKVKPWD